MYLVFKVTIDYQTHSNLTTDCHTTHKYFFQGHSKLSCNTLNSQHIAMFCVISHFVINVPTRDLLVPYSVFSNYDWHISNTTAMFVNTKHRYCQSMFIYQLRQLNSPLQSPEFCLFRSPCTEEFFSLCCGCFFLFLFCFF